MLTDIRALADHFLIALPNINTGHRREERGRGQAADGSRRPKSGRPPTYPAAREPATAVRRGARGPGRCQIRVPRARIRPATSHLDRQGPAERRTSRKVGGRPTVASRGGGWGAADLTRRGLDSAGRRCRPPWTSCQSGGRRKSGGGGWQGGAEVRTGLLFGSHGRWPPPPPRKGSQAATAAGGSQGEVLVGGGAEAPRVARWGRSGGESPVFSICNS